MVSHRLLLMPTGLVNKWLKGIDEVMWQSSYIRLRGQRFESSQSGPFYLIIGPYADCAEISMCPNYLCYFIRSISLLMFPVLGLDLRAYSSISLVIRLGQGWLWFFSLATKLLRCPHFLLIFCCIHEKLMIRPQSRQSAFLTLKLIKQCNYFGRWITLRSS